MNQSTVRVCLYPQTWEEENGRNFLFSWKAALSGSTWTYLEDTLCLSDGKLDYPAWHESSSCKSFSKKPLVSIIESLPVEFDTNLSLWKDFNKKNILSFVFLMGSSIVLIDMNLSFFKSWEEASCLASWKECLSNLEWTCDSLRSQHITLFLSLPLFLYYWRVTCTYIYIYLFIHLFICNSREICRAWISTIISWSDSKTCQSKVPHAPHPFCRWTSALGMGGAAMSDQNAQQNRNAKHLTQAFVCAQLNRIWSPLLSNK
jgi:hypothetical protein